MSAHTLQKRDARQDSEVPVQAAVAIQTKYRQYQAKSTVDERRREIAAIKIQSTIRGFFGSPTSKETEVWFTILLDYFLVVAELHSCACT